MKRGSLLALPALGALLVLSLSLLAAAKEQQATTELMVDHQIDGVVLKAGKYLIVHREHAAGHAAGEACFFFYHPAGRAQKNEVARFRCNVVSGEPAEGLALRTSLQPGGGERLRSVQFAGSRDIHELVPVN